MAKVRAPLFSPEVRGDLAAQRFRTWRNLTTVSVAGSPDGAPLQANFVAWQAARAHWTGLTEAQREAWREYGRKTPINKGIWKPKYYSGYTWARKAAYICGQLGETAPVWPWTDQAPGVVKSSKIELDEEETIFVLKWHPEGDLWIGYRFIANYPATIRFYDYQLGGEKFVQTNVEEIAIAITSYPSKARAAVRAITNDGQCGPISYVEYYYAGPAV